jgi:hypothetical protein
MVQLTAIGRAERPVVHYEDESDGDGHDVAADRHYAPDRIVQPSVGQSEKEVE